ncbi:MAG: LamB/YcsF family protein [Dehalococcoidia bacterium]
MQARVDINCDMGEGYGPFAAGFDAEIIPHISSANIACGFHAGDPLHMKQTVLLAEAAGVAVGAHPGLPDLMGFGRREMMITPEEAAAYVAYQIGALQAFTGSGRLQHVKPHGALYNMGIRNEQLALAVAEAVKKVDPGLILVGMAGSSWIEAGRKVGLRVAREVFADRSVHPDGTLVHRSHPGAVIGDIEQVANRVMSMVTDGKVMAIDGQEVEMTGDTICLHGDTPGASDMARRIRQRLESVGVTVVPMGAFCK